MASHNNFSFIDGQKSLTSNIKNKYRYLLEMLLSQFITLSLFSHSFTFISSDKVLFMFCNMCLLALPIWFFAGFSNVVAGRLKKFSLWSFNVMKLLLVLLISILSMKFASLACLIPSLFIFVAVWRVVPFYCIFRLRYSIIISRLKVVAWVTWNFEYLQPYSLLLHLVV